MSGIHLEFRPDEFTEADRNAFRERVANRTSHVPGAPVDFVFGPHLCAASSHHGVLPTGGVAERPGTLLAAWGSAWIRPQDTRLATPGELLDHFDSVSSADRRALGGTCHVAHCRNDRRELVVESDFWNALPIYFRERNGRLAVSSELKFLVEPGNEERDEEAVAEMLALGFLPRLHTLIRGVRRLRGNARLTFDDSGWRVDPFPGTRYTRDRVVTDDVIDEYDALVRRYLRRFDGLSQRFCISMSGGLDSRLLAAAALREGWELDAFTIGESGNLDARMAARVCEKLGLGLRRHEVRGDTFGDWFAKAIWFTEGRVLPEHMHYLTAHFSRETPPGPQLHGLVGEAVMGGHFDNPSLLEATPDERRDHCRRLMSSLNYWPTGAREAVYGAELSRHTDEIAPVAAEDLFERMGFEGSYSDYVDYRFRLKAKAFANPCIMCQVFPWSDAVDPFMDPDAYAFGAALKLDGIAERQGQIRWGLRHLPVIGELPRVKAGVLLDIRDPDPDAYRRATERMMRKVKAHYMISRLTRGRVNLAMNTSFPEYGSWYRRWGSVRRYVDGILLSEQTLDRGIFRREGLRKLLHDLRIGRNTWGAVSCCLMLEILLRQLLDGDEVPNDPTSPFGMTP